MSDPSMKSSLGTSQFRAVGDTNFSLSSFGAIVKDILLLESQRNSFFKGIDKKVELSLFPIGTIKFQRVYSNIYSNDSFDLAIPKKIHNTMYPKKGEMVKIEYSETFKAQDEKGSFMRIFTYSDLVSAWNNVEHNIVPKKSIFSISKESTLDGYTTSQQGIPTNKQYDEPYTYNEIGNIKSIYPLSDNILQGRGGNTIRLGTSYSDISEVPWKGDDGHPLIVIRNGQPVSVQEDVNNLFEDINSDGSSFYMLSKQTLAFNLACDNFESFNVVIPKNNIVAPISTPVENDKVETSIEPPAQDQPPVTSSILIPQQPVTSSYEEDTTDLEEATNNDYEVLPPVEIPVSNGIYRDLIDKMPDNSARYYGGVYSNSVEYTGQMEKVVRKIKVNDDVLGKVSPISGMPPTVKSLLDVISVMESTAGYGDFNGYDVYFGFYKLKGYDAYDSDPLHPNIKIVFNKRGDKTTAAGRYQFNYPTWSSTMGSNIGMSKVNQDMAAWRRMLKNVPQSKIDSIGENNIEQFKLVIGGSSTFKDPNCLAGIWASLPSNYSGPSGFYGQNTKNQSSYNQLFDLYQKAYKKYK